jgi:transcriptional regulator with XRE-family HTH domain
MRSDPDDHEEPSDETVAGEVRRLTDLLRTLVRLLGYTNRDVERRANLNHATAVRYFRGEGEPRLEFILAVVKAIGLEYWEFFELAYAQRPPESAAGKKLRRMLERLLPGPVPARPAAAPAEPPQEAAPLRRSEMEALLADFRREMREALQPPAAAAPEPPPAKPGRKGKG